MDPEFIDEDKDFLESLGHEVIDYRVSTIHRPIHVLSIPAEICKDSRVNRKIFWI